MPSGALTAIGSRQTIVADGWYNSAAIVTCANGDVLITWGQGGVNDTSYGSNPQGTPAPGLRFRRSTDGGATWGSTYTVTLTFPDTAMLYGAHHPTLYSDGSLGMVMYCSIQPVPTTHVQTAYFTRSTDHGVTWSAPVRVPTNFNYWSSVTYNSVSYGNTGGAVLCTAAEDPETPGRLYVPMHGCDAGQDPTYTNVEVVISNDYGATWTESHEVFPYSVGGIEANEPNILPIQIADGSWKLTCFLRRESGANAIYGCDSTDGGVTWTTPTVRATGMAARTTPIAMQRTDGSIMLPVRDPLSTDYLTGYRISTDYGSTFGSTTVVDSTGGEFLHSSTKSRAGVVGVVYSIDETPSVTGRPTPSGYIANVYYREYVDPLTTAAGYGNNTSSGYDDGAVTVYTPPAASIVVDPASTAWNQIGTQIIVRVTADAPSTVPVTFTSAAGSLVWFRGTDADLFEVSLDGTTWTPSVDVPAGETEGFLRVTPAAPGTALTAEIGISS